MSTIGEYGFKVQIDDGHVVLYDHILDMPTPLLPEAAEELANLLLWAVRSLKEDQR